MSVLDSAHWHSRTWAKGHPSALRHILTGMISLWLLHSSLCPAPICPSTDAEHWAPPLTHLSLRKVPSKFAPHVPVIEEAQKIDHFSASGTQWSKLYCPSAITSTVSTWFQEIRNHYGCGLWGQIKTPYLYVQLLSILQAFLSKAFIFFSLQSQSPCGLYC